MPHHFDALQFRQAGESFLRSLISEMTELGFIADSLRPDHLCFRVGNLEEYDYFKLRLSEHGELLGESPVNGRPISTFKMKTPFQTEHHTVHLVELPAPKAGSSYETGFEHAEFVISESFSDFAARYPGLSFTLAEKTLNPELALKLNGKQAKFHHLSLDRVIEIEQAEIEDVIFDLDGTLVQSNDHIQQRRVVTQWSVVSQRFSYELFDDAVEVLHGIANRGYRLHLWTARDEQSARKILQDNGIESLFQTLSFSNERGSKPDADNLRFNWRSAKPGQSLVIGDSTSDIQGAKNVGAIACGALWSPHVNLNTLTGAGAEMFFKNLGDLGAWLA